MKKADPFQVEPLPKAFYYPSKEKELSKKEKKVCLSVPISSQQQVTSPEDVKFLQDNNAIKEIPTRENGSYADQSSSSQFNESWPSTERAGSVGTPLSEGTSSVSSPVMTQQMRDWLAGQDKPITNSALGWFINRFRNAPPTSREQRDKTSFTNQKQADFWWLSPPSRQSTPRLETPPQKLKPSPKKGFSHKKNKVTVSSSSTSVHPSDNTTEELNRKAKELLERSETSMGTSSTEPFPLPLKKPSSVKQKTPELNVRQSSNPSSPITPATKITNMQPIASLQHHNPWPEDDILHQWRLARKMEKAQERASTAMNPKKVPKTVGIRTRFTHQPITIGGELGIHDHLTGLCMPQDHPTILSGPSETLPLARDYCRPFTDTPTLETSTTAVDISSSTNISKTVRLTDTSQVAMVTSCTMTTPVTTPVISHPCRHLERAADNNVNPHMHLACDILPCPCTEDRKGDSHIQQKEKLLTTPKTQSQNESVDSEEKKKIELQKPTEYSDVFSEDEKENEKPKDKKSTRIQGTRNPDEEKMESSNLTVKTKKQHSGSNRSTNESKRNRTSDMVESIIGKVVSEHLFSGDTSSDDNTICKASFESQSHQSSELQHGINGHNAPITGSLEETLLVDSSEEEFADDELLTMLRQRSRDLKSQLREIDNLLAQNK